jgi:5-methylcytosine-specific restriction endonuclease McrA
MKHDRTKIHQKFNGHCAYCGTILKDESGKYMQIDHVNPLIRNLLNGGKQIDKSKDIEKNMFPSCPKCNNYKHSMTLESFREQIKLSEERLKVYAAYNNAIRFGLIEFKEWDGLFYFERL